MQQDIVSIVIIDSGLGGLSICADIARGFAEKRSVKQVDLTYFNAWPEQNRGYNALPDTAARIRVFNSALMACRQFNPDMILIACNTLSILYPQTPFAAETDLPVVGIVDFGVQMVYDQLQKYPESQALILGTLTTVNTQTHKKSLVEKGIAPERISGQPCDQLATSIESGPSNPAVSEMIDGFLGDAAGKIKQNGAPVFAVFCCTHFGYSRELFRPLLQRHLGDNVTMIDPNSAMSNHVLGLYQDKVVRETTVHISVVSRIVWNDEKVKAIAAAVSDISPLTAEALRNYQQEPDLF
jgi:glutamate racemase